MDIVTATEDSITRPVAGADRVFKILTAYDRAELLRSDLGRRQAARAERKQKLIENLKLAGISGEAMFAELEHFDDAELEVNEATWIEYVNSVFGEIPILMASLKKTYNGEAEEIARQSSLSLADKAKLCGLTVVARQQQEDIPDPNSQAAPVTYSMPVPENHGMSGSPESATGSPA